MLCARDRDIFYFDAREPDCAGLHGATARDSASYCATSFHKSRFGRFANLLLMITKGRDANRARFCNYMPQKPEIGKEHALCSFLFCGKSVQKLESYAKTRN